VLVDCDSVGVGAVASDCLKSKASFNRPVTHALNADV
jgi:hypothetical protein